nr:MAG TPA: hypothetical protein [Caudoviricetes sp.]
MCFSALRLNLNEQLNSALKWSHFLSTPKTYFIKRY